MKSAVLVLPLVAGLAMSGTPVSAAGTPSSLAPALVRSFQRYHLHPLSSRPASSPLADARADVSSLRLPDSAFSPATVDSRFDREEDNATADRDVFRNNHSTSYEALGRVDGYYERANWQPPGFSSQNDQVIFRYQASIFSSPSAASNGWQDGITQTQSVNGASSDDCSSGPIHCSIIAYSPDGSDVLAYGVFNVNQCLFEVGSESSSSAASSQSAQIATTLTNMLSAALSVAQAQCANSPGPQPIPTPAPQPTPQPQPAPQPQPTPQPTPSPAPAPAPTITIDQVAILHLVKGKTKQTHTLMAGEKGEFIAIYHMANAGSATPVGRLTLVSGSHTLGTVSMRAGNQSGTPYFQAIEYFKVKKRAVRLTARFTLTLGTASTTRTYKFTVKPKK